MAGDAVEEEAKAAKVHTVQYIKKWGESPLPPTLLATLVLPLSVRPVRPFRLLFPPAFLFASYLNISGYETDAAGFSAAWSGLYLLLARRGKTAISQRFSVRGAVRGSAMALAAANTIGGGFAYVFGKKDEGKPIV